MKKLNTFQRAKVKDILLKARDMSESKLDTLRNNISSSNGNIKVKELILEGIDSIMNKSQLTNIALVPEVDLTLGESF